MSDGKRLLLTFGIPIALVGAIFYEPLIPGFLDGLFDSFVRNFVITYWFGLIFSNMYHYMQKDLEAEGASRNTIAIMAGGLALVFFIAVGGPKGLLEDSWMLGAAIMPGIDIALPAARDWLAKRNPQLAGGSRLGEPSTTTNTVPVADSSVVEDPQT